MKKILYISYDGMTDPLGRSQVLPYLSGLSKKNWKISLISFEKEKNFNQNKDKIEEICKNAGIEWFPDSYTAKPPVLSTMKDIKRMKRKALELHNENPFDIVHCRSYISALVGMYLKRKKGVKFLFDMRGFWADERVEGGVWSLKNPVYKAVYNYYKKKERKYFISSDAIVSLTENGKLAIDEMKIDGVDKNKITVIPCCTDMAHFDRKRITAIEQQRCKDSLGLKENDKVLLYLGSIGTWYLGEEMLSFYKHLHKLDSSYKFLFLTPEPKEQIDALAKNVGVDTSNILVTKADRDDVPTYCSIANLSVFFIMPVFSKRASSPTKQGELMSMGVPIVCNANVGDTDLIINKGKAGIVVPDCNDNTLQKAAEEALKMDSFSAEKAREVAAEFYSLEKGVDSYNNIYNTIIEKNN